MVRYIIFQSHLKPSKLKRELPDIVYEYIGNDSSIGWHYTFTDVIEKAYIFDDFQHSLVKDIARLLNMKIKELEV